MSEAEKPIRSRKEKKKQLFRVLLPVGSVSAEKKTTKTNGWFDKQMRQMLVELRVIERTKQNKTSKIYLWANENSLNVLRKILNIRSN